MVSRILRNLSFIFISRRTFRAKMKLLAWYVCLTAKYVCIYSILYRRKKAPFLSERLFNYRVKFSDYWRFIYLFENIFVQEEYFFKAANPAPRILDCGSNIGMSILYFKNLYPGCSVTGFEPDPVTFEILKGNMEANHIKDVELLNLALFPREGEIDFYVGPADSASLMMSVVPDLVKGNAVKVKTAPLSRFLDQPVDLVKMDIEGAELDVLHELVEKEKLKLVGAIILEYHHYLQPGISRLGELLKIFEDAGFYYHINSAEPVKHEEKGHGQGMIIYARRKN
jgi:FkbM family methyltransferase